MVILSLFIFNYLTIIDMNIKNLNCYPHHSSFMWNVEEYNFLIIIFII